MDDGRTISVTFSFSFANYSLAIYPNSTAAEQAGVLAVACFATNRLSLSVK